MYYCRMKNREFYPDKLSLICQRIIMKQSWIKVDVWGRGDRVDVQCRYPNLGSRVFQFLEVKRVYALRAWFYHFKLCDFQMF